MSGIINCIPRPARDLVEGGLATKGYVTSSWVNNKGKKESFITRFYSLDGLRTGSGEKVTPIIAEKTIKAACHTALATLALFAAFKVGIPLTTGVVVGALLSLPSVVVAGGSWMLYHGATAVISSLASGSLTTLGTGLAFLAGGWIVLEKHDFEAFGALEHSLIKSAVDNFSESLVNVLDKTH